jgi:hypothetical protein
MEPIFTIIEKNDITKIYLRKNLYLYLLIKYSGVARAEKSKWYQSVDLDLLVGDILEV